MPHLPRPLAAQLTLHVTAHALPRRTCFDDEGGRLAFLQRLARLGPELKVDLHAYALMDNHLHLLLTSREEGACAVFMRRLLSGHAVLRNRQQGQVGPLWLPRYSCVVVEEDEHVLNSCLYIDANPWRARLVEHPRDSRWTSYRVLAEGETGTLLQPHIVISQLADSPTACQMAYGRIMEQYLERAIRSKSLGRAPLASDPLAGLRLASYVE